MSALRLCGGASFSILLVAVLAIGVSALLFWHVFFNLGMVTGMLPVVGVTLPLFSYGGSSVMTVMIGLGLLMNVSVRRFQLTPRM